MVLHNQTRTARTKPFSLREQIRALLDRQLGGPDQARVDLDVGNSRIRRSIADARSACDADPPHKYGRTFNKVACQTQHKPCVSIYPELAPEQAGPFLRGVISKPYDKVPSSAAEPT